MMGGQAAARIFPMTDRLKMQDSRTQYPRPPFPRQPQPHPGLAAKMDPVPDHGETRYRGSGKLEGRKALVTGGDSGIGRTAAIAFAREGADVAIAYLPEEEPDAKAVMALIQAEGRKAIALPGDITDEAWCRELVDKAVSGLGGLDVLVINAGHQKTRESVDQVTSADFDRTMKTNLYALHWITQAAVPHLPVGASVITTASIQVYEPSPILLDMRPQRPVSWPIPRRWPSNSSIKAFESMWWHPARSGLCCNRAAGNRRRKSKSSVPTALLADRASR